MAEVLIQKRFVLSYLKMKIVLMELLKYFREEVKIPSSLSFLWILIFYRFFQTPSVLHYSVLQRFKPSCGVFVPLPDLSSTLHL